MAAQTAIEIDDDPLITRGEPSDEDEDDNGRSFEAFERQYAQDNSWESLQEDEQGNLRPLDRTAELRARRERAMSAAQSSRIRKGMIRYLLLVIDLSQAANAHDMRPNRLAVMTGCARAFIRKFFDLNPLGQLGLLVVRNGIAEKLTDLSGSPEMQISKLRQYGMDTGGAASLQNGLELGHELLSGVPPYVHRELLFLMAALSTVDPGRVDDSISNCKDAKIRVSIVGVSAEVHILRRATERTGGTYGVALNESHLSDLLLSHAAPPPAPPGQLAAELVRMGFPQRAAAGEGNAVFVGELPELKSGGYTCPRCKARTQELPCKCHVCGLMLISSPHLARSYHHLFPVQPYIELDKLTLAQLAAEAADGTAAAAGDGQPSNGVAHAATTTSSSSVPWYEPGGPSDAAGLYCFGCLRSLDAAAGVTNGRVAAAGTSGQQAGLVLLCGQCKRVFCYDCDAFVHETLHNCPGCESLGGILQEDHQHNDQPAAAAAQNGVTH